jgi:plastocyanin
MRRVWLGLLILAAACAGGPRGPQTYAIDVDAPSPEGEKIQVSAFFPGEVRVSPGDTIRFVNRSTEAPHTITLGVLADRSNQPPLFVEGGAENSAVFGPCYTSEKPTARLSRCSTTDLPAFDGRGYWNSGVLQPASAPAQAGAKDVTVELADDTPEGVYAFVCILHPFMNGSLTVTEEEADRDTTEEVRAEARQAASAALRSAGELETPQLEREGDSVTVTAGWGDRITAVNLYAPATLDIEAGTTVRWVTRSPYEPHTVTFESPYQRPGDPASFAPGGVRSGGEYAGGFANSGILGPEGGPFPSSTFELTFTRPGSYTYVCTLHPGQQGVVRVS